MNTKVNQLFAVFNYFNINDNESNKYYTVEEVNSIIDKFNEEQKQPFHRLLVREIEKLDSIVETIRSIYETSIMNTLHGGNYRTFIDDFHNYILKLDVFEQERLGLRNLISQYYEYKLIVDRLRQEPYIIDHATNNDVREYNLMKFLYYQSKREELYNQQLNEIKQQISTLNFDISSDIEQATKTIEQQIIDSTNSAVDDLGSLINRP